MVSHHGIAGRDFPIDELRRVLTSADIKACGWDLDSCKLTEELRLAALADQRGQLWKDHD